MFRTAFRTDWSDSLSTELYHPRAREGLLILRTPRVCAGVRIMRKQRRGRPATGKGIPVQVRFQKPLIRALDDWLKSHPGARSRADAVRRLVEMGLKTERAQTSEGKSSP